MHLKEVLDIDEDLGGLFSKLFYNHQFCIRVISAPGTHKNLMILNTTNEDFCPL